MPGAKKVHTVYMPKGQKINLWKNLVKSWAKWKTIFCHPATAALLVREKYVLSDNRYVCKRSRDYRSTSSAKIATIVFREQGCGRHNHPCQFSYHVRRQRHFWTKRALTKIGTEQQLRHRRPKQTLRRQLRRNGDVKKEADVKTEVDGSSEGKANPKDEEALVVFKKNLKHIFDGRREFIRRGCVTET